MGDATEQQKQGRVNPTLPPDFAALDGDIALALRDTRSRLICGEWHDACCRVALLADREYVGAINGPRLSEADADFVTALVGHWLWQRLASRTIGTLEGWSTNEDFSEPTIDAESPVAVLGFEPRLVTILEGHGVLTVGKLAADFEIWYPRMYGPRHIGNAELSVIYEALHRFDFLGRKAAERHARHYLHNSERKEANA